MVRSNSLRGNPFGEVEEKLSRTFSLSSSEASSEYDDRYEGAAASVVEAFIDEETAAEEQSLIEASFHCNALTMANLVIPPDLRVPLEKLHVPRRASGFFMESMVRRDETKTRFIMYKQSTKDAQPIFCAQKYPPSDGGQILIKSVHSETHKNEDDYWYSGCNGTATPILGSLKKRNPLRKAKLDMNPYAATTTTTYELVLHESATIAAVSSTPPTINSNNNKMSNSKKSPPLVVATIDYEQISRARYFVEGGRPRSASVSILGKDCGAETKEPHQRSNGQKVLDFGGRGRETSSKNTQLVRCGSSRESSASASNCCLQMVKWKDNEFNLDFGAPFDAFHAFAFALAQFDF